MILRVFHGVPTSAGEADLVAGISAYADATFRDTPELTGFQLGIQRTSPPEISIATTWTSFDAILRSGQGALDAPRTIGGAPSFFVSSHADHYELVIGGQPREPIPNAHLRVTTVPIKPGMEASYFETSRDVGDELVARYGLLEYLLGRRTVGDHTEVCAVTLWPNADTVSTVATDPEHRHIRPVDFEPYYAAPPSPKHYEPILVTARPSAPPAS